MAPQAERQVRQADAMMDGTVADIPDIDGLEAELATLVEEEHRLSASVSALKVLGARPHSRVAEVGGRGDCGRFSHR
jgi:hypothetical protein